MNTMIKKHVPEVFHYIFRRVMSDFGNDGDSYCGVESERILKKARALYDMLPDVQYHGRDEMWRAVAEQIEVIWYG